MRKKLLIVAYMLGVVASFSLGIATANSHTPVMKTPPVQPKWDNYVTTQVTAASSTATILANGVEIYSYPVPAGKVFTLTISLHGREVDE